MIPSERVVVTVFGMAFVSAVLSTPFLGFAPMLGVIFGLGVLAAAGKYVELRQAKARRDYDKQQTGRR